MALTIRTKRIVAIALCADKKLTDELISKIETPAVLSARLKKALRIMLPDKKAAGYEEIVYGIEHVGPLALSTRAKDLLKIALDDRKAALEVIAAIEA